VFQAMLARFGDGDVTGARKMQRDGLGIAPSRKENGDIGHTLAHALRA
jgi:hypothetical protein